MLSHFHAARLAFPNHSPLRERREVCFAGGPTGSTSSDPEKKAESGSFDTLADEIDTRLNEFTTLLGDRSMYGNERYDEIRTEVTDKQDRIRDELVVVTDTDASDDNRMAALVRAEKMTAEIQALFEAGSDESQFRKRMRGVLPNLLQSPELNNDSAKGQKKLRDLRQNRDEALRLLEEAAKPGVTQEERQKALTQADALIRGLESVDKDLEKRRRDTINTVIHDTRNKLKELLPQIQQLDELKDEVLSKDFLDAETIIGKTHQGIEDLLTTAEKDDNNSRNALSLTGVAQRRVEKMQAFLDHILSSREKPQAFTMQQWFEHNTKEKKGLLPKEQEVYDKRGKKKKLTVNGYYSQEDKKISMNADLSYDVAKKKFAHEKRHLFLHALEGLDEGALTRLYDTVKNVVDPRTQKTFKTLLLRLSQGDTEPNLNPLAEYQLYGAYDLAVFEELLVRAADEKAGIGTLDAREREVLAVFREARTPAPEQKQEKKEEEAVSGKRFSNEALSEDIPPEDVAEKPVEKKEKVPPPAEMREKVHAKQTEIYELSEKLKGADGILMSIPNIEKREEMLHIWHAHRKVLQDVALTLSGYDKFLTAASDWEGGKMDPEDLTTLLNRQFLNKRNDEAGAVQLFDADFINRWRGNDNISNRIAMVQEFPLDKELEAINKHLKLMDSELPKIGDNFSDLEKLKSESGDKDSTGVWGKIGLEFYSINQVIESVTNVVNSYTKAWGNWSQLKVSRLSNAMGKATGAVLPFGDQARVALEMDLDHKNDEVKDEYKKHLEHDLADFKHCSQGGHGHPSLLKQYEHDPNKFRGILEYMASKGWLYDLDVFKGTVFKMTIKDKLPTTWAEERKEMYIRDLEQQNSSGQAASEKAGKDRVTAYPNIPPMIEVLKDELNRCNYWATLGILERITEKGKHAYSPIWASVIIMDYIKNNPFARQYFPEGLRDKIGTGGLNTAMIHYHFKSDRTEVTRYQKNYPRVSFKEAGKFAYIFEEAREAILARRHENGLPDLNEADEKDKDYLLQTISQVLAGRLVTQRPGEKQWSMSLFENVPAFEKYRTERQGISHTFSPKDLDDDYYNPDMEGSELVLISQSGFREILGVASEGAFKAGDKARAFLEQLLRRYDQMRDENPDTDKSG